MQLSPALTPIVMLFASNLFMTFAWYGHLRYKAAPLALAIVASWASPSSSTAWRCRPTAGARRFIRRSS